MNDKRRRRKLNSSQENLSEGESQQLYILSLSDSEYDLDQNYVNLSEFDSAEENDNDAGSDNKSNDDKIMIHDKDEKREHASVDMKKGSMSTSERTATTKQEEKNRDDKSDNGKEPENHMNASKRSDDDDEWDSPFFTPVKGKFYQHDMRSKDTRGGRRLGQREFSRNFSKSKWVHDRYDADEQAPKSKDELVAEYGYDIRAYRYDRQPQISNSRSRQRRRPDGRQAFSKQKPNQSIKSPRKIKSDELNGNKRLNFPQGNRPLVRSQNFQHSKSASSGPENDDLETDQRSRRDDDVKRNGDIKHKVDSAQTKIPERKKKSVVKTEVGNIPPMPPNEQRKNPSMTPDKTDPVLSVIDKWEKVKLHPDVSKERETAYRQPEYKNKPEHVLIEKTKKLTTSEAKEAPQPRRYSSLRLRAADSSANPQKHLQSSAAWNRSSKNLPTLAAYNFREKVNSDAQQGGNSNATRNVSNVDRFHLPKNMSSNEVAQEVVNSLFTHEAAIAYQESLIAQSRATLLSAALHRQKPFACQLSTTDLLSNNELKAVGSQIPPISRPVNQSGSGASALPTSVLHNFSPNIDLTETPILNHNSRMPFLPNGGLIGQDVGGAMYYRNSLQPIQNSLPPNTSVNSLFSRMETAMPIRQSMQ